VLRPNSETMTDKLDRIRKDVREKWMKTTATLERLLTDGDFRFFETVAVSSYGLGDRVKVDEDHYLRFKVIFETVAIDHEREAAIKADLDKKYGVTQ
jgi:hypothetical protein